MLGIRAYDTQKDVVANNKKLLDFVSAGGTLVVQYNTGVAIDFNSGKFTPYPAELSRARVSVEEAPVEILAPDESDLSLSQRDHSRKISRAGCRSAGCTSWTSGTTISRRCCHVTIRAKMRRRADCCVAQYGKGTYIYTGYAFFRQLPAGVPGAVRLFVNLLSAGINSSRSDVACQYVSAGGIADPTVLRSTAGRDVDQQRLYDNAISDQTRSQFAQPHPRHGPGLRDRAEHD